MSTDTVYLIVKKDRIKDISENNVVNLDFAEFSSLENELGLDMTFIDISFISQSELSDKYNIDRVPECMYIEKDIDTSFISRPKDRDIFNTVLSKVSEDEVLLLHLHC